MPCGTRRPPLGRVERCRVASRAPAAGRRRGAQRPCADAAAAAAAAAAAPSAAQPALLYDFHDCLVPYEQAWEWQRRRVAELCDPSTSDRRDTVFLLQHPPVYTLGAGSSEEHVKFDLAAPPHPLYRTERGGEVTYHGPGQLVLYPVLDLTRHRQDLHWYLRALEEIVIRALGDTSGLAGERLPGLTGVWVAGCKLAAVGVRARKWVTYHGLALNVSTHLGPFAAITPCGIADRPVGSVRAALAAEGHGGGGGSAGGAQPGGAAEQLAAQAQAVQRQAPPAAATAGALAVPQQAAAGALAAQDAARALLAPARDPLIVEYRYALLEALEDVLGLSLQPASEAQRAALVAGAGEPAAAAAAVR
ncbi:LIP2P [Scenedesmus sp. PABB004]|nr:LIP2P [Scenedesmus sp. PABB004]